MATNFTEGLALPDTIEAFWKIADDTRLADEFASDDDLMFLTLAPYEAIRRICFHYRFFTKFYIDDLAVMIARLPFGELKSYLGTVLNDELGHGDPRQTHLQIYDNFLASIGYANDPAQLDRRVDPRILRIVEELSKLTRTRSTPYVVGLRGMGAECLCQVYLTRMYRNILENPHIGARRSDIDWAFWDFHAGEADILHRQETRRLINKYLEAFPGTVTELAEGYFKGRAAWKDYWDIAFEDYQTEVCLTPAAAE